MAKPRYAYGGYPLASTSGTSTTREPVWTVPGEVIDIGNLLAAPRVEQV